MKFFRFTLIFFIFISHQSYAEGQKHRQLDLTLKNLYLGTEEISHGTVSITKRSEPNCSVVKVSLYNAVPRPSGTIFTLYMYTSVYPMYRITSFNTGFFSQNGGGEGVFCIPSDDLVDHWLDPSVNLEAVILSESTSTPPPSFPRLCRSFVDTECTRYHGESPPNF